MSRIICLANSVREGGRCIAGIDVDSGHWIRPVPPEGGEIPNYLAYLGGRLIQPLDIIELTVREPRLTTKYQRENRIMATFNWRMVGTAQPRNLLQCCDASAPILHTNSDRVSPEYLDQLDPTLWKSLQLVRANPVAFEHDHWNTRRWRATFQDSAGNRYSLKVTDPFACSRLASGGKIGHDCLLTISLAAAWAPDDGSKAAMCYKLVAGVIEL